MQMYKTDLARTKYNKTELFSDCIGISCPNGYIDKLDQIVDRVKAFNKANNVKMAFSQIKMKFGFLSIYTSLNPSVYKPGLTANHTRLLKYIKDTTRETEKMCKICGNQLTEMVIDTQIVKKCFDHYAVPDNRYGVSKS